MQAWQRVSVIALIAGSLGAPLWAQDATEEATQDTGTEELLTSAELEQLLAPVALYPDTVLIQVLVASTFPLEVVKAERFLAQNEGAEPEALKDDIEAQGWDPSVTVLATAFPDVISLMAEHIDWTESAGTAMLAQTDDVMDTVQVLRDQAIETGALVSGPEQTVETDADDEVVIVPTDPEVVYVPQYEPAPTFGWSDAIVTGAIIFGTVAIIDEIFDDDDDWDDYWGCRNCGGWGGGPIIRDPDIDIDIDGNVNIGNDIDLGDRVDIDRDKIDTGDIGWRPEPDRRDEARDKIADHRGETGATRLPLERGDSQGDALRAKLSEATGAPDISGGLGAAAIGAAGAAAGVGAISALKGNSKVSLDDKKAALDRTKPGNAKPAVKKPAVKKPAVKKPAAAIKKPAVKKKPAALKKTGSAHKVKAGAKRGKASGAKHKLKKR